MDSDACVGSKRSVEESRIPEADSDSKSSEIVSPVNQKQDPNTLSDSPKKLKSSPQELPTSSGFQEDFKMGSENQSLVGFAGIQESLDVKKKQLLEQVEAMAEEKVTSLKFEVIDETALIQTMPMGFLGHAPSGDAKQQVNGKKARNQRRKEKLANGFKHVVQAGSSGGAKNKKVTYSRMELEALRYVNPAGQTKLWKDVYNGLGPLVAREYDDLAISMQHQKNTQFNSDHRKRYWKMDEAPGILGVGGSRGRWNQMNVFVH